MLVMGNVCAVSIYIIGLNGILLLEYLILMFILVL